jgi:thermostable 8-oxoguanine DNA glycosylase
LETFDGADPKTSGWVVRNVTGSDDVAIINIWVARACRLAGVFDPSWRPDRDYRVMESTLVQYAETASVLTSALDLCIWEYTRRPPRLLCAP